MDSLKYAKIGLGLLITLVVVQTWAFWAGADAEVAATGWLADDAFFYAVIAEHLVGRGAMEFYPGMETNGFQPLWMAFVATAHGLVPSISALTWIRYLSVIAFVVFAALAMWLMSRDEKTGSVAAGVLAAVVIINPGVQQWVLNGLETAVALAVITATMVQTHRVAKDEGDPGWADVVILAVLGVSCFFARTDLFVVSLGLTGWLLWRCGVGRRLLVFVGVTGVCVLPYLIFNVINFGSLVPLSGRAQQFYLSTYHGSWQEYVGSEQWQGIFYAFFELVPIGAQGGSVVAVLEAATIAVPIGAGYVAFRNRRYLGDTALAEVVRFFLLIAAVHLAVMYGYHRGVRPFAAYYFAPTVVVSCMALALAAARHLRQWKDRGIRRSHQVWAVIGVGLWVVLLGVQSWAYLDAKADPFWEQRIALSADMDELIEAEEATVGAYWPGALAYFTQREVIPLDGVIASATFQDEVMRSRQALPYLCSRPQPWLAVYLHRSLEMWRDVDERPVVEEWMWAHKLEMWEYGMERFEAVSQRPAGEEPGGWYLLRLKGC